MYVQLHVFHIATILSIPTQELLNEDLFPENL